MNIFKHYFLKREIEDWRETTIMDSARVLGQVTAQLLIMFDQDIAKLDLKNSLIKSDQFITDIVDPEVRKVIEPVVALIIKNANDNLNQLVASHLVWTQQDEGNSEPINQIGAMFDVAIGVGPIVGGGILALAIPSMAVTTTTGWFGLAVTTAVSWPVILAGGTAVGAAVAVGAFNVSRINVKAQQRVRNKIKQKLYKQIMHGTPEEPSILDQLTILFNEAAEKAKSI